MTNYPPFPTNPYEDGSGQPSNSNPYNTPAGYQDPTLQELNTMPDANAPVMTTGTGKGSIWGSIGWGWKAVFRSPVAFIVGTLLVFALSFAISTIFSLIDMFVISQENLANYEPSFLPTVGDYSLGIVTTLLTPLFMTIALRAVDKKKVTLSDTTEGINYWPTIGIQIVLFCISFAISLVGALILLAPMWLSGGISTSVDGTVISASAIVAVVVAIILYFIFIAFVFSAPWLVADRRASIGEALKQSIAIGKRNFFSIIGFSIAEVLVMILGFLACGVGLLVATPLILVASAHFYRSISAGAVPVKDSY